MKHFILFSLIIFSFRGYTQTVSEQDCPNAIPVCQSSYTQANSYTGTGFIPDEINSGISCLSSGEKNDVWYTFTVTTSGNLNFLITPNSFSDDYDWAIYNLSSATCADIYNNPALQVSCNYSALSGNTGANGGSTFNSQDASGSPFNALIPVNVGETYVVNVSNYSSTQFGYTLNFGSSTAGIYDNVPPELLSVQQPACGDSMITFNFSENILCSSVQPADFSLFGPNIVHSVISATGNACVGGADYDNTLTIALSSPMIDTGQYYLIVIDSVVDICNNTTGITTDTLAFTITGITVSASPLTDTICIGQSVVLNASGANTYGWSPSTGLSSTSGSTVTTGSGSSITYLATGTTNGCSDTASVEIIVNPLPVVSVTPASVIICIGNPVPLVASGGFTYFWTPSTFLSTTTGDTVTATPDSTITYSVITLDINGCTDTTTVTIVVDTSVAVTMLPDSAFICKGDTVGLTVSGSVTYVWSPAVGLNTISGDSVLAFPSDTTTFFVTGNSYGCIGTDSVTIIVYPIPVVIISPANPVICEGDSVNLVASGAKDFYWEPLTNMSDTVGSSIFVSPDDTTIFSVVGNSNSCVDSANIKVIVNSNPLAMAGPDTGFCTGGVAMIGGSSNPGCNYLWTPYVGLDVLDSSFAQVSLTNNTSNTVVNPYFLSVSINNCTSLDTVLVSVYPDPNAICEVSPKEASEFSPTVSFTSQSLNSSVCTWFFENGDSAAGCNASYTYPDTGTYLVKLEVYSEHGCYGETTCNAIIFPEFAFYLPNSFTPDGDEMNDFFSGQGIYIQKYLMRIFDRWGDLVFQSEDPNIAWDGKIRNVLAKEDVYIYKIKVSDIRSKRHEYRGIVTLVK